jgi:hypothetical protein
MATGVPTTTATSKLTSALKRDVRARTAAAEMSLGPRDSPQTGTLKTT